MLHGYKILALCITKAATKRSFEIIEAFSNSCLKYGYRLFIYHSCSDFSLKTQYSEGDKAVFSLMDFNIIDAVILFDEAFMDTSVSDMIAQSANQHNIPLISVCAERENAVNFVFDYAIGFEQLVRHVIEYHNARNTCFIAGGKGEYYSEERISIYKKVLFENGIEFKESRLFYGDYWHMPTEAAVEAIIASGDIPEAIICANDNMAITTSEMLTKRGYSVPGDIIVTGFDGSVEARSCTPPITTCKCELSLATDTVISAIGDIFNGIQIQRLHKIPYSLDVYRSCGCNVISEDSVNVGNLIKKAEDRFFRYQSDERAFYELSESVLECYSPHDLCMHLHRFHFYNTSIILNNDCFDKSINPANATRENSFDDEMMLLYESHVDLTDYPMPFKRSEVIHKIDYTLDQMKNPITFSSLSFFGVPMGYAVFSFTVDIDNYCKILQYVTSLNNIIGSYRTMRYLRHTADNVERMSKQDFMTGLCNRQGFYNALPLIVESAKQAHKYLLVATIDIDGLKMINDTYGHEEGDFAIKSVSDTVAELYYPDKICGRFGGDEIVVCAVCNGMEDEAELKQYISNRLKEVNDTADKPYPVSASIGICIADYESFNFEEALKISDEKMYIMKIGRPNRRRS